ncbi:MAG: HD family phosphohydrolase [Chloroflexota bacterium]
MFGLTLALGLFAILTFQFLPSRYALNQGDVSPYDVKSPFKVTYVSQIATARDRQRAAAAVSDVYRSIPNAAPQAHDRASSALSQLAQIRLSTASTADKLSQLSAIPGLSLSPATANALLSLDDTQWQRVASETLRLLDRATRQPITAQQVGDVQAAIPSQVDPTIDDQEATVVIALTRSFVAPTEEVDQSATRAAQTEASDAVPPHQVTIEKGETILRNGDVVSESDVERLEAAGLRNPVIRWRDVAAMALISLALTTLLCAYLFRFQPVVSGSPRRLLLLGVLLLAEAIAAKLTIPGREYYGYLFPSAAVPMLLAMLLDTELGLLAAGILAVIIGLSANTGLELVVSALVAGGLGALAVHRLERVNVLSVAALVVTVADFVVIVAFQLMNGDSDPRQFAIDGLLALISGGLAAALTLGTVSFLGHIFGIATTMNLLELAHPSQPLFRRLLTEAPGTYHHSVVVANLAERAAAIIGADTLLCRIGGYYHDIGKLTRPYAFIENQNDGQNVHDQLDAYTSARVILAHVTDGLVLADKHRIPMRVRDMIAQHHGTMLVQYFYRQASQGAEQPVDESAFRYGGPRPQSREAAIMMLADGVEATVRSCRDRSAQNIQTVVDQIVRDRIGSGQLDECQLTMSDLHQIREAFLSVLQGIYHPRIEYPAEIAPVIAVGGVKHENV